MGSICDDVVQLQLDTSLNTKRTPTGGVGNSFTVTVGKKEVVAAVLPMQEHWLPLSNLDLLLPPVDVGVFFCYSASTEAAVGKLKKALAQALVTYYAFAGEVVVNSGGEPEILCNNRGVEFWEAYADVELRELDLYNPDDAVEGKLVPVKKDSVFAVQKRVEDLVGSSLSHVADGVHEFLSRGTSGDHFLGLVDWVEAHRPEPAISRIYSSGGTEGPAFVVSSGRGFPIGEVDFGWGRPVFGSYHFPWGGSAGYVMPMPSPKKEGDWVVYMHLFVEQLEVIEKEGGSVFRPFSWDCLM
ncbi:Coniferyl alcohol acyltransferase [Linum perenne]